MSLVERALKKIQESRGSVPPALPVAHPAPIQPPAGSVPRFEVTGSGGSAAHARAAGEPPRPRRVIHIDQAALRAHTILPPENEARQLASEYRQIKRPLIASALGRGEPPLPRGHLIMIASALPGEGKTFTSINLALSMALEKDSSVLLVDADVARPRVSAIFGIEREPGLLDVLHDAALDVESLILATDVPGLSILPAGRHSETATELLASTRMQQVAEQIGARDPNGIVLFDSPPLLLTTESRALAMVAGQVVLVVRAGSTPQQAVLDALVLLGEDKPVGLVLNESDEQAGASYYQYYGQRAAGDDA